MNHTFKEFLLAGVALIIIGGITACNKPGPTEKAAKSMGEATEKAGDKLDEQSNKAGTSLDDAAITAKVKAVILAEPGLPVLQINVDTTNGVTTLSGSVDSQQSSDRAKEIAAAVSGVNGVRNRLVVKSAD